MKIRVILEFKCELDKIEVFTSLLNSAIAETRVFEGCSSVEILSNSDDPSNIVLLEIWDSRNANEKYLQWRTETGMFDQLSLMLKEKPLIRYYDIQKP